MKTWICVAVIAAVACVIAGCGTQASTSAQNPRAHTLLSEPKTVARRMPGSTTDEGWYRRCKVRITALPVGWAAGTGEIGLELDQVGGQTTCPIEGYPTVRVLNSHGRPVRQRLSRAEYSPLEPTHVKRVIVGHGTPSCSLCPSLAATYLERGWCP